MDFKMLIRYSPIWSTRQREGSWPWYTVVPLPLKDFGHCHLRQSTNSQVLFWNLYNLRVSLKLQKNEFETPFKLWFWAMFSSFSFFGFRVFGFCWCCHLRLTPPSISGFYRPAESPSPPPPLFFLARSTNPRRDKEDRRGIRKKKHRRLSQICYWIFFYFVFLFEGKSYFLN